MEALEIKKKLIDEIEHSSPQTLKDIYGLIINYLNGKSSDDEWERLSETQKKHFNLSIQQAELNQISSVENVLQEMREKYGLNE